MLVHHLVAKENMDEEVMKALQNKEVGRDALLKVVNARIKGVVYD